jgi:hypothetical protein
MKNLVRVAIIDDHPLFREGVANMLTSADGIEVVGGMRHCGRRPRDRGGTRSGRHAPRYTAGRRRHRSGRQHWPCVSKPAYAHADRLRRRARLRGALQAGARDYILKGSSGHEVVEALRAIAVSATHQAAAKR